MGQVPIKEKYELEVVPIGIGGARLELFRISNWDIFVNHLEEKGDAYVAQFPFWVRIWEASIVLADYLTQAGLEREKEVLEIGAGMGLTGLFLGALGHKVTITDHEDDALELLRMNAAHNGLDNVSVKRLDWEDPDLTGQFDIICGSELIYKETSIEPIIRLFRKYLHPHGTVFLAHDVRRKCVMQFIGMVQGKFEMENMMRTLNTDTELHRVVIHILRLKH